MEFAALAIDAADGIELTSLRQDELGELSVRFASVGRLDEALKAVSRIDNPEQKSRFLAEVCLEISAQGRWEEAINVAS